MHANNKIKQNQRPLDFAKHQLAEELQNPIITKFFKKQSLFQIQRQYLGCWFNCYAINKQV